MKQRATLQSKGITSIRNFFIERGFLDVLTPPLVQNPGMEPHIHPFEVSSKYKDKKVGYLHTSPEFHMKELLSEGLEKIFTLTYCFRDEPFTEIHRNQFVMLEWYRSGDRYESIESDSKELIDYLINQFDSPLKKEKWEVFTIQEIIKKYCHIDILEYLHKEELKYLIETQFKDVPLPKEELLWEDYFFLLFLNKVEPFLKNHPLLILKEYPHYLSALSTLKKEDPRVCERFEIYINGIEIGNCFNELTDYHEQMKRFEESSILKEDLYKYRLPFPEVMEKSLKKGLPQSSGIAIGVERLLSQVCNKEHLFFH